MNEEKKITVYITKFALSKGVYQLEAVHGSVENVVCGATPKTRFETYFLGKECFLTLKEANTEAEKNALEQDSLFEEAVTKVRSNEFYQVVMTKFKKFVLNALHLYFGIFFLLLFVHFTTYLLVEWKEVIYMAFSAVLNTVMAVAGAFVGFYLYDKILNYFGYER